MLDWDQEFVHPRLVDIAWRRNPSWMAVPETQESRRSSGRFVLPMDLFLDALDSTDECLPRRTTIRWRPRGQHYPDDATGIVDLAKQEPSCLDMLATATRHHAALRPHLRECAG